jgi:streptogramin lyase
MTNQLDRDMDQTQHGWMQAVAPVRAPGRLLEDTFSRTVATGQARNLPWRGITVGPRRRVLTGPAGWIAVGVAVALVGATIFGTGLVGQPGLNFGPGPSASRPERHPQLTSPPRRAATAARDADGHVDIRNHGARLDGRALWVLTEDSKVARIDTVANTIAASGAFGPTGEQWQGLAATADALWVTDWDTRLVYRIDPATLKTVTKIETGSALKGVLATTDAIWIADTHAGTVIRIDPKTNKVVDTITVGPVGSSGPNWLASGLGSIWVDIPNNDTVLRIDPATDQIQATIPTGSVGECSPFGIAPDAVWVTDCFDGTLLSRIDPRKNELVNTVDLGGNAGGVTMIDGEPWVAVDHGVASTGQLVRIDPVTTNIDRVLVPGSPMSGGGDLVVIGDSVWVLDGANNRILRLPVSAFSG